MKQRYKRVFEENLEPFNKDLVLSLTGGNTTVNNFLKTKLSSKDYQALFTAEPISILDSSFKVEVYLKNSPNFESYELNDKVFKGKDGYLITFKK
jgi:hypothetical protein